MIKLKKPIVAQPQTVVRLNQNHPLAKFCVGFWISSTSGVVAKFGGSELLAKTGTAQSIYSKGYGTTFGTYASTNIILLPDNDQFKFLNSDASIVFGATCGTLTNNEYPHVWAIRNSTTTIANIAFGLDGTGWSGGRVGANIGTDFIGTSGSAKQGEYAVYGFQWGSPGRKLYVNGVLNTSNATTTQITSNTIQPSLGNRVSGGRAMNGALHWWVGFNTAIGEEWQKRIALDPYQLLEFENIALPLGTFTNAYSLTAEAGTYSLTGQTATLLRSKVISASNGTYSLTGQNATITYGSATNYTLIANHGTYAVTGQSATLLRNKVVSASHGTYSLAGQAATVAYSGSNIITLKAGSWLRYRIIQ